MIGDPVVSVILPCYNGATVLPDQLQALTEQHAAPPFEVLVVDNRSTDAPAKVVDEFRQQGLQIKLVPAMEHQGVSYARNVGIRESRADYLMFCDADDVVSAWWLAQGLRTFETAELWTGSYVPVPLTAFAESITAAREAMGDSPEWRQPDDVQADLPFPLLMGGNFGATRAAITGLGGFDQSLPVRGEDNELALRAVRAGYSVPVSRTVRVAKRERDSGTEHADLVALGYADAMAYALLSARFGLWGRAPFGAWPIELAKTLFAGLRCVFRPSIRKAWEVRWAQARGWAVGSIRYKYRSVPSPRLGIGFKP